MTATLNDFVHWVGSADRGERYVYHVGTSAGGDICREAMLAYERGFVLLLRKRKDRGPMFYYIAHRTEKKK
jgi:hypothetical protein